MNTLAHTSQPGRILALCLALAGALWGLPVHAVDDADDLQTLMRQDVNHDDRSESTVTSVGKRNQKLSESAAAVFVITQDDLRRSGVTSIPDALRMVPGLEVARIDSNKWAISSRGYNSRFANKLLVLMDGREVYSPTFGGVYWEVQDTPLADIDRIEVIRGPGASLWGANAVNGVVNITTKAARDTLGGHVSAGAGTYEKNFGSFRYGHQFDENTAGRVWASGFNRGSFDNIKGGMNHDSWDMARTGFRLDRDTQRGNAMNLIGNAYSGTINQFVQLPMLAAPYVSRFNDGVAVSGFNLLGRWKKALSLSSDISLQAYYDHTYRRELLLSEERDTFDLEFQHRLLWGDRQSVNWGLGYRMTRDDYGTDGFQLQFLNRRTSKQLFSLFVQDDIELIPNALTLTLGTKLQHNDFTGFEGQPSLRLLWQVNPENTVWGAISRAVRTPTRGDTDSEVVTSVIRPYRISYGGTTNAVPILADAYGSSRIGAEELLAYEVGYRFKPHNRFYLDTAWFYNDYKQLRSFDFSHPQIDYSVGDPYAHVDGTMANGMKSQSFGTEWLLHWEPTDSWKMDLSYTFINTHFHSKRYPFNFSSEKGMTPQQQVSLRSGFNLGRDVDLDLWLRYVDRLPLHGTITGDSSLVPSYVTLDTRLAWRPHRSLELSLVGQNLLSNTHTEIEQELFAPPRSKIPRAAYFKVDWRF